MASDNQTALMMSIQRKKDTLKFLIKRRKIVSENGCMADVPELDDLASKIEVYEDEITEDEKLLAVDRQNHIYAHMAGMESGATGRPELYSEIWYNEKYGTDGK